MPIGTLARGGLCALLVLLSGCGTLQVSIDSASTTDIAATGTVGALETQNAALATRVAVVTPASGASTPLPRIQPGDPSAQSSPPATRITFLNGASVGVVSAPIAPDQSQAYVVDAFQNQPMFVYVASGNGDVTAAINTEDGNTILSEGARQVSWQGTLPKTGDYYITLHGGAFIENFTLTVTVPWRLQYAPGEDSITLGGKTVAGYNVSYTVFASKGQTMSVDLEQLSSKASLSIYGFTDGKRYLRSDAGQKSYEFVLPVTQDYIVVIVPYGGSEVDYILTVKIK